MPKCRANIDIAKLVKAGRGQGRGRDYMPWLDVRSFSSLGYVSRVRGWKTGREHHLMSNLETELFYLLDWSERVTDVREQYPLLPVEETVAIAEALGFRHPSDARTKSPIVLTTDFLVTMRDRPRDVEVARTVKPASELESLRTLEKLQIELQYWRSRKVQWSIVTDAALPQAAVENIKWVHPYLDLSGQPNIPPFTLPKIDVVLRDFLQRGHSLSAGAQACDDKLGLAPGTSLALVRHFIATRQWVVDMTVRIDPTVPLKVMNPMQEVRNGIVVREHAA